MDPEVLVDNIIIWFGHEINQATYDDYLNTYVDIAKLEHVSSLIYRLFYYQSKAKEFRLMLASKGISVVHSVKTIR